MELQEEEEMKEWYKSIMCNTVEIYWYKQNRGSDIVVRTHVVIVITNFIYCFKECR